MSAEVETDVELKWLEDFVSLARTRSFSQSAAERNVTQSAFSRRIRALEGWLAVPLVDRATQPTRLTEAGRHFLETAEETVRALYASRDDLQPGSRASAQVVAVAALHTLSLRFFPQWFRAIEAHTGELRSRLLPDGFHACLRALVEESYDFMLMLHHPSVPILLDAEAYPHLVVGEDRLTAVRNGSSQLGSIPLLSYPADSFFGRMTALAQRDTERPDAPVAHTNESAVALKFMVVEGHGYAWLPRSLIEEEIASGALVVCAAEIQLQIRLYRNARRRRSVVEAVWRAARICAAGASEPAEP